MNITKIDLLQVTEDEKKQIHKVYNQDDSKIQQDVTLIRNWLVKQPHLPQDISGIRINH